MVTVHITGVMYGYFLYYRGNVLTCHLYNFMAHMLHISIIQ